jgi:hypothetical protein
VKEVTPVPELFALVFFLITAGAISLVVIMLHRQERKRAELDKPGERARRKYIETGDPRYLEQSLREIEGK